jgi:acylphosphatase
MDKRAEVIYRGNVQGVGFRYTARALALDFAVTGFVKNITDGSVQVVAQGETPEVERFLAAIDARMGDLVRTREVRWLHPAGDLKGFAIRF